MSWHSAWSKDDARLLRAMVRWPRNPRTTCPPSSLRSQQLSAERAQVDPGRWPTPSEHLDDVVRNASRQVGMARQHCRSIGAASRPVISRIRPHMPARSIKETGSCPGSTSIRMSRSLSARSSPLIRDPNSARWATPHATKSDRCAFSASMIDCRSMGLARTSAKLLAIRTHGNQTNQLNPTRARLCATRRRNRW